MMDNLEKVMVLPGKTNHLCFGLAALHAKIRFMETILQSDIDWVFANR